MASKLQPSATEHSICGSSEFNFQRRCHLKTSLFPLHRFMIRETERRLKERSDEEEADRTFVERMKEMLKAR